VPPLPTAQRPPHPRRHVALPLRRAARCGLVSSLLQSSCSVACSARRGSVLATRVGNPRLIRHNLMLPVLADLYTQMGFEFDYRPTFIRIPGSESGTGEDKLLDSVARCPGDRDKSVGVDLTVIATMAAKYGLSTSPPPSREVAHVTRSPRRSLPRPKPRRVSTASTMGPWRR
jgi:hypothetical protein